MTPFRVIQPLGPSHRDDGPPYYIKGQLNAIPGVTCERKTMLEPEPTWGEYDAVIEVDWGQDCDIFAHLPKFSPNPHKPSVCWQSDTHYNSIGWEYRMQEAKRYRASAWAQKDAADAFPPTWRATCTGPVCAKCDANMTERMVSPVPNACPKCGQRTHTPIWMTHAADHTIYTPPLRNYGVDLSTIPPDPKEYDAHCCDIIPIYDICFVGHPSNEERNPILDKLFKAIPSFAWRSGVFFRHAARVFHQSRIVFNAAIKHEINMRTFESLATRSFLLTDRQHGMDLLGLKSGVHCEIYDTLDEAIDKARWYLDPRRDALRRHIADQGWRWFLNGQTYWHRARTLLSMVR